MTSVRFMTLLLALNRQHGMLFRPLYEMSLTPLDWTVPWWERPILIHPQLELYMQKSLRTHKSDHIHRDGFLFGYLHIFNVGMRWCFHLHNGVKDIVDVVV